MKPRRRCIYAIDQIADRAILDWLQRYWQWPVEIVMEGIEDHEILTFPRGTAEQTVLKCIIDPIDGTRGIMYDKRAAWILAGIVPQRSQHLGRHQWLP